MLKVTTLAVHVVTMGTIVGTLHDIKEEAHLNLKKSATYTTAVLQLQTLEEP